MKSTKHNIALKLDSIGFVASTLCAIHCAAMPFVLIFLTMYGLKFFADPLFEIIFISTSVLIGVFTFRHGYLNHHKQIYPIVIFVSGLLIVVSGHYFIHSHEQAINHADDIALLLVTPAGAFLIGFSHFLNRKLTRDVKNKSCSC